MRSDIRCLSSPCWPLLMLLFPFIVCLLGAWAWFNTNIGRPSSALKFPNSEIWLAGRTNVAGYTFLLEPVSEEVKNVLGTTNILSGTFYNERATETTLASRLPFSLANDRITVFLATWSPESEKPISVLDHTPDICWTGSGWKPVNLDGPQHRGIHLKLNNSSSGNESETGKSEFAVDLIFEYGLFEWPGKRSMELAAWCRWIPGERVENSSSPTNESSWGNSNSSRIRYLSRFWRRVESRTTVRGPKQLVRLSLPVADDQDGAFKKIETFAVNWLRPISHHQPGESTVGNIAIKPDAPNLNGTHSVIPK